MNLLSSSLFAIATLLSSGPLAAATPLPANPSAVLRVGEDLLAITADWQLWRRPAKEGADWRPVAPLPEEKGLAVTSIQCAPDTSGLCLVTFFDGRASHVVLFRAGQGLIRRLSVNGNVDALGDGDTAYVLRNEGEGKRALYRYRITDGSEARLGTVQAGENVAYLRVDGALTPLARPSLWQFRSISDAPDAPSLDFGEFESLIATREGGLILEEWAHDPPVKEGARLLADIRFVRAQSGGRTKMEATGGWFFAFPTSDPLPVAGNGAADGNDDVVLEMASAERSRLAVLCRAGDGPAIKSIADLPANEVTRIIGGGASAGFLLVSSGPAHTPRYSTLNLSPFPGGWRKRPCSGTTASITDANVMVELDAGVEARDAEAVSADGSHVPYAILLPKGVPPRHAIIDVYGAFGLRRDIAAYAPATRKMLADSGTAVVFPIVRGDGNKGFAWAMASAAPNRQRAVDDVIAVAKDVVALLPSLQTKPTIRGQSAGGWLAMKAVLERPDLFAGAVGYSGAYLLKGDPIVAANRLPFFDPVGDDLAADVAKLNGNCRGLHFRLLHARDDEKIAYARAEAFAQQLKAQGCEVQLESFDRAGHQIALSPDRAADFERLRAGYFTPF